MILAIAFLLTEVLLVPTSAVFQSQPGSTAETGTNIRSASPKRTPPPKVESEQQRTRRHAARFADCVVKKRTELARTAVLDDVHQMDKQYRKLLDSGCLKSEVPDSYISEMRFPGDTFHEVLADALIRLEYRQQGPFSFASLAPHQPATYNPQTETQLAKMSPEERARTLAYEKQVMSWIFMDEVGDCVARRSPETVRALAFTEVTSAEERVVLKGLVPDLQACVPKGMTFSLSMSSIRGPLVRSYYRLARQVTVTNGQP